MRRREDKQQRKTQNEDLQQIQNRIERARQIINSLVNNIVNNVQRIELLNNLQQITGNVVNYDQFLNRVVLPEYVQQDQITDITRQLIQIGLIHQININQVRSARNLTPVRQLVENEDNFQLDLDMFKFEKKGVQLNKHQKDRKKWKIEQESQIKQITKPQIEKKRADFQEVQKITKFELKQQIQQNIKYQIRKSTRIILQQNQYLILYFDQQQQLTQDQINKFLLVNKSLTYATQIREQERVGFSQVQFVNIQDFIREDLRQKFQQYLGIWEVQAQGMWMDMDRRINYDQEYITQYETYIRRMFGSLFIRYYQLIFQEGQGEQMRYLSVNYNFMRNNRYRNMFFVQQNEQNFLTQIESFAQTIINLFNLSRYEYNEFCQKFFNSKTIQNQQQILQNLFQVQNIPQIDNNDFQQNVLLFCQKIVEWSQITQQYMNDYQNIDKSVITGKNQLLKIINQIEQKQKNYDFMQNENIDLRQFLRFSDKLSVQKVFLFQFLIQFLKTCDQPYLQRFTRMIFFPDLIDMNSRIFIQNQQDRGRLKERLAIFRFQEIALCLDMCQEDLNKIEMFSFREFQNVHMRGTYFRYYISRMFTLGRDLIKTIVYNNYDVMAVPEGQIADHPMIRNQLLNNINNYYDQRRSTFDFDEENLSRLVTVIQNCVNYQDFDFLVEGRQQLQRQRRVIIDFRFDIVDSETQQSILQNNVRRGINLKVELNLQTITDILQDQDGFLNNQQLKNRIRQLIIDSSIEMFNSTLNRNKDDYLNSEQFDAQLVLQLRSREQFNNSIQLVLKTFRVIRAQNFLNIMARDRRAQYLQAEQQESFNISLLDNQPPMQFIHFDAEIQPGLNTQFFYGKYQQYVSQMYQDFEKQNQEINCLQRILKYFKSDNYQHIQTLTQYKEELQKVIKNKAIYQQIIYFNCHVFVVENYKHPPNFKQQEQNQIVKQKLNQKLRYFNNKQTIIYYDIETTTGVDQIMEPLIICYKQIDIDNNSYIEHEPQVLQVEYEQQQISDRFIEELITIADKVGQQNKVYVQAWNGSKFDNVLILKSIVKNCQSYFKIQGSSTNIKQLEFRNIIFQDSMLNCGGGSLDSFCKSMGLNELQGKIQTQEIKDIMFKLKTKNDYIQLEQQTKKKYIEYCVQDVECMCKGIQIFNNNLKQLIKQIIENIQQEKRENYKKSIESLQYKQLLTIKTLPTLSYEIMMQIINQDVEVNFIDKDKDMYDTMSIAYRGGMTQVFSTKKFQVGVNQIKQIQYVDVNSEYPFVMSENQYYLDFWGEKIEEPSFEIREDRLYVIEKFDLGDEFILGYFPVKINQDIIYPQKYDSYETFKNIKKQDLSYQDYKNLPLNEQYVIAVYGYELKQYFNLKNYLSNKIDYEQFKEQNQQKSIICQQQNIKIRYYYQSYKSSHSLFTYMRYFYEKRLQYKKENQTLAQIFKIIMNSSYGQLGMREYTYQFYYPEEILTKIHQQDDQNLDVEAVEQLLKQTLFENNLKDVVLDEIDEIQELKLISARYKNIKNEFIQTPIQQKPRLKHIAGQITSYARSYLLEKMYLLYKQEYFPIYCDTDSIIYVSKKQEQQQVIQIGDDLGDFKYEYENIFSVQCIVPKIYNIQLNKDATQQQKEIYKSKGIQLKQALSQDNVQTEYNYENIQQFYNQLGEEILKNKQDRKQIKFINQLTFKRSSIGIQQNISTKTLDLRDKREQRQNNEIYNLKPFNNIQQFYLQ